MKCTHMHSWGTIFTAHYTFAIIPLHNGYIAKLPTSAFCWTYVSKVRKIQKILRLPRNLSVFKDSTRRYVLKHRPTCLKRHHTHRLLLLDHVAVSF